jgi:hypothetical protein
MSRRASTGVFGWFIALWLGAGLAGLFAGPAAQADSAPPPELKEPAITYWRAAVKGSASDATHLGVCYEGGNEGAPQNDERSLYWLQKGVDGGDPQAEAMMGGIDLAGAHGRKADPVKGAALTLQGARGGSRRGEYNAFCCLSDGTGCTPDPSAARQWLLTCAERSFGLGQLTLAKLYSTGDSRLGFEKNLPLAYLWSLAADSSGELAPDKAVQSRDLQKSIESSLARTDVAWLQNRWSEISEDKRRYDFWIVDTGADESFSPPAGGIVMKHGLASKVQFENGELHLFLIDTGSSISVTTPEMARRLNLKRVGELAPLVVASGAPKHPLVEANGSIEGVPFQNLRFEVQEMSPLLQAQGIEGILGSNLIRHVRLRLDPGNNRITLLPKNAEATDVPKATPTTVSLPLTFDKGVPYADVIVESASHQRFTASALIDTGNQDGAAMNGDFNATHPFASLVARSIHGAHIGMGGITNFEIGRIASIKLGPCLIPQPLLLYTPDAASDLGLPLTIFRNFPATFDYANAKLEVMPGKSDAIDPPFNEVGYRNFPGKGGEVVVIFPHTPAEDAGLKVGDIVESVDGHPALVYDSLNEDSVYTPGSHMIVVKRGDKSVTLTLVMQRPI